jgi:hypothetical protein
MTKNDLKKLIKSLTKEILVEDFDNAAEVESDKLTATLSETDKAKDIKDLENLLKNPDPSRAKDYGSIEKYKQMLKDKIVRLKESGDPFRDIVKKYAKLYRDSEDARSEKSNYNAWLQSKAQQDPKLKKALQLMKKSK